MSDLWLEGPVPSPPVRMEFVGGAFCGCVLLPVIGWLDGTDRTDGGEFEDLETTESGSHRPTLWHFLEDDLVCLHGPTTSEQYFWVDQDYWYVTRFETGADTGEPPVPGVG